MCNYVAYNRFINFVFYIYNKTALSFMIVGWSDDVINVQAGACDSLCRTITKFSDGLYTNMKLSILFI